LKKIKPINKRYPISIGSAFNFRNEVIYLKETDKLLDVSSQHCLHLFGLVFSDSEIIRIISILLVCFSPSIIYIKFSYELLFEK